MERGDLVTIAVSGDYGKPRPALVIQADAFNELGSVTVLRLTSELHELHDWPNREIALSSAYAGSRCQSHAFDLTRDSRGSS